MILHPALEHFWAIPHPPLIELGGSHLSSEAEAVVQTIILSDNDYIALQAVFQEHFSQTAAYMERLTDALLSFVKPYPATDAQHQEGRRIIQTQSADYLFHKNGVARDHGLLERIQQELAAHGSITLSTDNFFRIAILVVGTLPSLSRQALPLHQKINALIERPIQITEPVLLCLQLGGRETPLTV